MHVGRHFSRFLVKFLLKAGTLIRPDQAAQCFVQSRDGTTSLGKPAPMSDSLHAETSFVLFKSEPQCFNFRDNLIKIYIITIF